MIQDSNGDDLTLDEFCELAGLPTAQVLELIQYGVVNPRPRSTSGSGPRTRSQSSGTVIYLSQDQLLRCLKARRLQQDLELNLPGVALVMELLDKQRAMARRLACLEQMLDRLAP